MVPVEVEAFGLLAIGLIVLALVLVLQVTPRRLVPWPIQAVALAIVAVLALIAFSITRMPR